MRGGEIVNMSIFVLEVCTSVWDECGVGWAVCGGWVGSGGGLHAIFFQNAAIVSKIEQCRAAVLTFLSINYHFCTYLCLNRLKKQHSSVKNRVFNQSSNMAELP